MAEAWLCRLVSQRASDASGAGMGLRRLSHLKPRPWRPLRLTGGPPQKWQPCPRPGLSRGLAQWPRPHTRRDREAGRPHLRWGRCGRGPGYEVGGIEAVWDWRHVALSAWLTGLHRRWTLLTAFLLAATQLEMTSIPEANAMPTTRVAHTHAHHPSHNPFFFQALQHRSAARSRSSRSERQH